MAGAAIMSVTIIIPARYASTRLPGKPLLDQTGKPLIQHVVEAVRPATRADDIIVATDDDRIMQAVTAFGGKAVLTSRSCRTGTDRLAEAADTLGLHDDDIVVNVQGDEPDITASMVDELVALLESSGHPLATQDRLKTGDPFWAARWSESLHSYSHSTVR